MSQDKKPASPDITSKVVHTANDLITVSVLAAFADPTSRNAIANGTSDFKFGWLLLLLLISEVLVILNTFRNIPKLARQVKNACKPQGERTRLLSSNSSETPHPPETSAPSGRDIALAIGGTVVGTLAPALVATDLALCNIPTAGECAPILNPPAFLTAVGLAALYFSAEAAVRGEALHWLRAACWFMKEAGLVTGFGLINPLLPEDTDPNIVMAAGFVTAAAARLGAAICTVFMHRAPRTDRVFEVKDNNGDLEAAQRMHSTTPIN